MRAMWKSRVLFGVLCALVIASAASAGGSATPGVTSKQILIGGTTPLSGPASAYAAVAKGADAYFKYANAHGGVFGRSIKYKYVDDAYDPSQTIQKTRDQLKVPQLLVASGASTWGNDYKKYPWTIGYQPSYKGEATLYGRYIAKAKPKARIGVLYQNDDYGKELVSGLQRGLGKKAKLIVSKQGYDVTDTDVKSQMARLKSKRANTLMVFATPKFAIQSYSSARVLGWRPLVFVNSVASASNTMTIASLASTKRQTEGSISIAFLKDPINPRWAGDRAVKLFRTILKKYNGGEGLTDYYNVYGMSSAFTLVDALRHAGKSPTRASVMHAITHLNERNNPFVLPGVSVRTTSADHFPIAQARLQRYHNGHWVYFGPLVRVG